MEPTRPVLRVGLTGGIASGKSTAGRCFAELGAFVVDADRVSRTVVQPGRPAFRRVRERFGESMLAADGTLDREALGALVFADPDELAALNEIVHPEVRAEVDRLFAAEVRDGSARILMFDAALLVETGAYRDYDRLIVVYCSRQTQIERLLRRDGAGFDQAAARIDAQAPTERKLELADYAIETEGPLGRTRERVREVFDSLIEDLGQSGSVSR